MASIVIVGGGPAGAASAIELANADCDVVLLERQRVAGWKIGETLPPESRTDLQRLGVWEQFVNDGHLPCHGVVSAWGHRSPVEKDYIFNAHGNAWQLDRALFENSLLAAAADSGCRVCLNESVELVKPSRNGWLLKTQAQELETQWLVDASGRSGRLLRGERGAYRQLDNLVSVYAIAKSTSKFDEDARTYVEANPNGWCYTALTPSGLRTVAFQTDADLLGPMETTVEWFWTVLSECPTIFQLLTSYGYGFHDKPQIMPCHSGCFERFSGDHWLAVGDSAMSWDPLSGQGAANALRLSQQVREAICSNKAYSEACASTWESYCAVRTQTYEAETRWSDRPFWRRRQPQ